MHRSAVALLVLAACSRGGPKDTPDRVAVAAPPPASSDAGVDDAAPDAAPVTPGVEGSAPVDIALPRAPVVTVRAVGPAMIEVVVDDGPAPWTSVEIERHEVAAAPKQHDTFKRSPEPRDALLGRTRRHVHAAKPGTSYAYRARASGGAWSAEVTVRTAQPGGPPEAPASFSVQAMTPYSARTAWDGDPHMAAGYELEMATGEDEFVRAAVTDPTTHDFVHHQLLPATSYRFRMRAFNALGVSTTTPIVTLTTPAHGHPVLASLPACKPLPPVAAKPSPVGLPAEQISVEPALWNVPGAKDRLERHLYGQYDGCMRELGVVSLQAELYVPTDIVDERFPLLRGVAGGGEFAGAQLVTLRFSRGRYTQVDESYFCGTPYPDVDPADPGVGSESDVITGFAPPFATCQRDFRR